MIDPIFTDWPEIENRKHVLALFVVVKFFVVLGIVGFLVWTIRRNAAKQCPETAQLLDELEQAEDAAPGKDRAEQSDDWERDADWWKR